MKQKEKIIVVGGGGHAKVVISIIKKLEIYDIIGYTDIEDKGNILGIKYLGTDDSLNYYFNESIITNAVLGIGQIKSSEIRVKIYKKLKGLGYTLPAIVSPDAIINEDVKICEGTVVMDGVVVNSGTKIGRAVILNTKSSVDHDCVIGNFTHIAPGVTISGGVGVGNNVLLGTGAIVTECKSICNDVIVGAGATVVKNIEKTGIYIGTPAKKMDKH